MVVDVNDNPKGGRSVWLVDVATGSRSRVTFGESDDWLPIWSRDGERVLFGSYRNGPLDLYQRPATGAAPETVVLASEVQKDPSDWSRDGATLLINESTAERLSDVVAVSIPTGARTVVAATGAMERSARFSPDDRWVAYASNESGQAQVYVQPFPPTGAKWQISTDGGTEPKWSGDGRELYYFSGGRGIMAGRSNESGVPSRRPAAGAGTGRGWRRRADLRRHSGWRPLPGPGTGRGSGPGRADQRDSQLAGAPDEVASHADPDVALMSGPAASRS